MDLPPRLARVLIIASLMLGLNAMYCVWIVGELSRRSLPAPAIPSGLALACFEALRRIGNYALDYNAQRASDPEDPSFKAPGA